MRVLHASRRDDRRRKTEPVRCTPKSRANAGNCLPNALNLMYRTATPPRRIREGQQLKFTSEHSSYDMLSGDITRSS